MYVQGVTIPPWLRVAAQRATTVSLEPQVYSKLATETFWATALFGPAIAAKHVGQKNKPGVHAKHAYLVKRTC